MKAILIMTKKPKLGHVPLSKSKLSHNTFKISTIDNKKDGNKLKCGYVNSRSLNNKTMLLKDIAEEYDFDVHVFMITETWLSNNSDKNHVIIEDLKPEGYDFLNIPRSRGKGGGVGVLYESNIRFKHTVDKSIRYESFEHLECVVSAISPKQ